MPFPIPTWKRLIPRTAADALCRSAQPRKALWMTVAAWSLRWASSLRAHSINRALKTGTNREMIARAADLSLSLLFIKCARKAWGEEDLKKYEIIIRGIIF